ncbi:MAG TPA: alpha/beta hydrolase [Dongiaceae bacterium]|jgi:pimeloyl-ACP methyl ester carboxylesterase|nr:alpha/beta hydrolase [Dongiaceae bacterium]
MSTQIVERMAVEIDGDGDPVILLHGLGGTSNSWTPQMSVFAGRFRVIRPDLPGSGRSPLPSDVLSIDLLADLVIRTAEKLGIERAHLAGHSMGTIVCQHVAVRAPKLVRSLALIGVLTAPPDAARKGLKDRAQKVRAEGMSAVADAVVQAATSSQSKAGNPVAIAAARESLMRQAPDGYAAHCEALSNAVAADPAAITCPTLLIAGEDDVVAPPSVARGLADKLKGARVHVLPRVGHWLTFEAANDVNTLLKEFLSSVR